MSQTEQISKTIGDYGARIANLESDAATVRKEYREDIIELFARLDKLDAGQVELKTMVSERAKTTCPDPGSCLRLTTAVNTMSKQIDSLRLWRSLIVGGSIVAWVVICALVYAAWDWAKAKLLGAASVH